MTILYHAHAARNDGPLVPDRAAIIAEDDRRRAPMRLFRAEAERDRARRRRLFDRAAAERACIGSSTPARAFETASAHTVI